MNNVNIKAVLLIVIVLFVSAKSQSQTVELNTATFGIGTGISQIFEDIHKASLSTDTMRALKLQTLSRYNFVISSMVVFKLGKLQVDGATNKFLGNTAGTRPKWYERLSLNLAINLLEINSENISFNKSIDGGLGLGFFLTSNMQLAVFLDIARYRQLQDYVKKDYENKRIPNGTGFFNALDENNNDLFYTKTVPGCSFKAVFSIGNKK